MGEGPGLKRGCTMESHVWSGEGQGDVPELGGQRRPRGRKRSQLCGWKRGVGQA